MAVVESHAVKVDDDLPPISSENSSEIRWKNVTYTVPYGKTKEPKVLLKNATGYVRQGQMVAIMGGSGAGKSTLLNTLAGRIADQKGSDVTGEILFNGEPRNPATWTNICSYVEQDDLMFTNLSVEETLTYAAQLRLPSSMLAEEKRQKVDEIIMQLNLNGCRKTWIGDSLSRGISGGERKRVAIGVELVTNPSVLFLDEPTSGLDSANALGILKIIKKLAITRGIVILMTVHQPRTEILDLCDKIILLSMGKTLWFGPTDAALAHFKDLGHPLPEKTNPSDFFLDVITMDLRTEEAKAASLAVIEKFHNAYQVKFGNYSSPFPSQMLPADKTYVWPLPWYMELFVLYKRNMKDVFRNKGAIGATIGQAIFLIFLMGAIPLCWVNSLLMSICLYWMVGLQVDVVRFFTFVLLVLNHSNTALSLAYCIGSAVPTPQVGQILGPLIITIFLLFGGQLLNIGSVSWVFRWIQYVSLISYTYKGLVQNEFDGLQIQCTANMNCQTYDGSAVVASYSVDNPTKYFCVLINFGLGLGFLALGYTFFQKTSRPMMRLK
ncbi:ATP-binding cassette sub- G member 2 [Physocladia obscura]|uniref:ATP-binding cassette sub- G member 2 n=1 Tax=Physocladia obscura TaxID=109957 RepID=A0AAD5XCK3_9FUNG|nr:ATP-binding cassette sub- G member 2 [Physocladia obscura]